MNPLNPKKIHESAETLYTGGLCCSESALLAIAQGIGVTSPCLPAVASGFCGGMARTGGPCGALTGAIMGLGLALGRASAADAAQPAARATQRLVREFGEIFGGVDCHKLVGFDPNANPEDIDKAFTKEGRRAHCARFTGVAAGLAANILLENADNS